MGTLKDLVGYNHSSILQVEPRQLHVEARQAVVVEGDNDGESEVAAFCAWLLVWRAFGGDKLFFMASVFLLMVSNLGKRDGGLSAYSVTSADEHLASARPCGIFRR